MQSDEKVRENRYRRWAGRLGLALRKSRGRLWNLNDQGGYRVVYDNTVLAGEKFDLGLDDIELYLKEIERKQIADAAKIS
jgi:hypothetical protein